MQRILIVFIPPITVLVRSGSFDSPDSPINNPDHRPLPTDPTYCTPLQQNFTSIEILLPEAPTPRPSLPVFPFLPLSLIYFFFLSPIPS